MAGQRRPGLYVIFDGPPGPESGRFVEVENELGASVGMDGREWVEEPNGLWRLGPFREVIDQRGDREAAMGDHWRIEIQHVRADRQRSHMVRAVASAEIASYYMPRVHFEQSAGQMFDEIRRREHNGG